MASFEFKNIGDVAKSGITDKDQWFFTGWPELFLDEKDAEKYFAAEAKARDKEQKIADAVNKLVAKSNNGQGAAKNEENK